MDPLILSRLKQRVEMALTMGLLLSAVSGILLIPRLVFAGMDHSELNEARGPEPDPWPQVELPAHSDYTEAKRLLSQHKWEESGIVLRSVLKKSPEFFPAAIELARALVYLGRREEASTILAQTVARQSGARKALIIARIRVLSRIFLTQKTFQTYQDGLNLVSQQKYRAAREHFEKALGIEPDNIEILVRLGQCLVLDGDYDSAAERLRIAKRLNPYEPEVSLWLGRALHQRGELSEAMSELKAARDNLGTSERAPIWYAEALLSSGNRKAAVQVLEADADAQPFHLVGVVTLARIRTELFKDGADSLWGARKDLQVALSRLPQYGGLETPHAESELGVELRAPAAELKTEITGLLAQLDGRLRDVSVRQPGRSSKH